MDTAGVTITDVAVVLGITTAQLVLAKQDIQTLRAQLNGAMAENRTLAAELKALKSDATKEQTEAAAS